MLSWEVDECKPLVSGHHWEIEDRYPPAMIRASVARDFRTLKLKLIRRPADRA